MSGTSLDGVDAVLVEISQQNTKQPSTRSSESVHLIDSLYLSFSSEFQVKLKTIVGKEQLSMIGLGELDVELGELFADAANQLLEKSAITSEQVAGIASHGLTLFHQPSGEFPFTWQIADANVIAARTGCTVVADFRRMDVALSGQGAPLVPVFHQAIAPHNQNSAFVNIGGMANVTLIQSGHDVLGFDTGPGNVLMNEWISKCQNKAFDENGQWAKEGHVDASLLKALLDEPYFEQGLPKSTGRELFNMNWLMSKLEGFEELQDVDVQATLLALTAETIAQSIQKEMKEVDAVYVCGGGAQNAVLMKTLQERMSDCEVLTTEAVGVHPDWVEAVAFAWLGYRRMMEQTLDLKSVTGSTQKVMLGGVYKPA